METRERSHRPRAATPPRPSRGVTLIELMVTLVVLAILVSAAVPSFVNMVRNNQRTAVLNRLLTDIQLARSEAIKSGVPHVICPAFSDGETCDTADFSWSDGWIVFRDDPLGSRQFQIDKNLETPISATTEMPGDFTVEYGFGVTGAARNAVLVFRPSGQTNALNGRFGVCDPRGNRESRAVVVFRTGRAYISDDTSTAGGNELCPDAPDSESS